MDVKKSRRLLRENSGPCHKQS